MDLAPITIGRKKTLFQLARVLLYSLIVLIILYTSSIYRFDEWLSGTIERSKHRANTELQMVQRNIFLLMGSQETFTLNLGQRIQEELTHGRIPTASVMQPYVQRYTQYNPALLVAALVQDGEIIARYPPDQSCDLSSTTTLLSLDTYELGPNGEPLVSLDGPLYCEKERSHLVNRLPIIVDGKLWAFLHIHYDFETFLTMIGTDTLNDEYRYSFLFSHPGGDETYLWGEAFDPASDPLTIDSTFSSLSWTMSILPRTLVEDFATLRQSVRLYSAIISLLVAVILFLIIRQYQRAQIIAATDSLTGAYNRRGMTKELRKHCKKKNPFCLVLVDVDDFKEINDNLGYGIGDAALLAVARKIVANVKSDDRIARYGGDEFIVLLRNCTDIDAVSTFFDTISPVTVGETPNAFAISLSMGAVFYPTHGTTVEALLAAADQRIKQAKKNGKGVCFLQSETPQHQ